jgi:hypothetical protein
MDKAQKNDFTDHFNIILPSSLRLSLADVKNRQHNMQASEFNTSVWAICRLWWDFRFSLRLIWWSFNFIYISCQMVSSFEVVRLNFDMPFTHPIYSFFFTNYLPCVKASQRKMFLVCLYYKAGSEAFSWTIFYTDDYHRQCMWWK